MPRSGGLDVVGGATRTDEAIFFVALAFVMVGIAALARLATRRLAQRGVRHATPTADTVT